MRGAAYCFFYFQKNNVLLVRGYKNHDKKNGLQHLIFSVCSPVGGN
jgi:hypothetical protein